MRDDIDIEVAMEVVLLFATIYNFNIECKIHQYSRGCCLLLVAARGIWFLVLK